MSVIKELKEAIGMLKYPARLLEYRLRYKGKTISLTRTNGTVIEGEVVGQSSQLGSYGIIVKTLSGHREVVPLDDVTRYAILNPGVRPLKSGMGPVGLSFHIKPKKQWADFEKLVSVVKEEVNGITTSFTEEELGPSLVRFTLDSQFYREWTVEVGEVEELEEEQEFSSVFPSTGNDPYTTAPVNGFASTADVDARGFCKAFENFSRMALRMANELRTLGQEITVRLCFALLPKEDTVPEAMEKLLSSALPGVSPQSVQVYAESNRGVHLIVQERKLVACGTPEDLLGIIRDSLGG